MAKIGVIGAGIGGLSAATALAAEGHEVVVFEAMHEVGGKIGRTAVGDVYCDTGPSVLTMPDVFRNLFELAGTRLEDEIELVRHEVAGELAWADGMRLRVHNDVDATRASIAGTLGHDAAEDFRKFMEYARGIWDAAAPAFVYGDAPTMVSAMAMGMRRPRDMRRIDPMRTMLAAIHHHVADPYLRDLFARYATYNGSDPRSAPATLNCIAHVELAGGGYGVRGGMYRLAESLKRVATSLGVEFRLNQRVEAITRERGHVTGLETAGASYVADAIVVNADVGHLFSDLLPDRSRSAASPSMSGWTAIVKTTRAARPAHAVLFGQRYLAEFEDIFDEGIAPRDPTVYVCAQAVAHDWPQRPPHDLLFCMANAPATSQDRGSDFTALGAQVLAKLRHVGWISDTAEVVWHRTPGNLAAQFPGTAGAIYGASSNSRLAAFQRPANRVSGIGGLYLASGSAHPGGGVPLCALSGRAAARAVATDFPLRASRASG